VGLDENFSAALSKKDFTSSKDLQNEDSLQSKTQIYTNSDCRKRV